MSPSIRFGLGGLLFLYWIQPLFYKLARRIPDRVLAWLTGILALVMAVDFVFYLLK